MGPEPTEPSDPPGILVLHRDGDAHASMGDYLARMLPGARVHTARSCPVARKLLDEHRIDILLTPGPQWDPEVADLLAEVEDDHPGVTCAVLEPAQRWSTDDQASINGYEAVPTAPESLAAWLSARSGLGLDEAP